MSKFKEGDKCKICGREYAPKKRFINHHVSQDPEITVIVCHACHSIMHGSATIYKHPMKEKYGRARFPHEFALAVVDMYDEAYLGYR